MEYGDGGDFSDSDAARAESAMLATATATATAEGKAQPQMSVRAVLVGSGIGVVLCFTNMYFGLQTGWVTMGSIQSAVVGYAIFRFCLPKGKLPFTTHENVVVQTVAVATATLPLAGGFVGIIPALKMIEPPDGPARIGVDPLVQLVWALALSYFGIFFAVPLRRQTILVEQLRFPSGTATAKMIEVLHGLNRESGDTRGDGVQSGTSDSATATASGSSIASGEFMHGTTPSEVNGDSDVRDDGDSRAGRGAHDDGDPLVSLDREAELHARGRSFLLAFGASFFFSLLSYFVQPFSNIPVFDALCLPDWTRWHWTLRPSLSYVGQGMIMGLRTASSAFAGAVVAWGVLGPLAYREGWVQGAAPIAALPPPPPASPGSHPSCEALVPKGAVDSWEFGAQGWVLWVALPLMLAEALTAFGIILVQQIGPFIEAHLRKDDGVEKGHDRFEVAPQSQLVPVPMWLSGLLASSALAIGVISPMFAMPVWQTATALVLSCLIAVLAVRALGETDLNPVSAVGKLSQVIFALIAPGHVVANVVAGAVAEAAATQVGDLMQDLKTGHLLRSSPRAQFYSQLIGSTLSAVVTVAAYQLYSHTYSIPSEQFPALVSHVWKDMAVLMQKGLSALPATSRAFGAAFAAIGVALPLVEHALPHAYASYLPSGIAFGIGMYVTADWSIPRLAGALLEFLWRRCDPRSHELHMLMIASGFVLGEGVMSIVALFLTAMGVPKLIAS